MERHTLNNCAVLLVTIVAVALAAYPEGALHCYSSLTRPDNMLICPQGRPPLLFDSYSTLCFKIRLPFPIGLLQDEMYFV